MKSQTELYQALESADKIIRDNSLFETLNSASKMVSIINLQQVEADKSDSVAFRMASSDIIKMYASLLDETIDDIQAIAYSIRTAINFGLMEPEAEKDMEGYYE